MDSGLSPQPPTLLDPSPPSEGAEDKGEMKEGGSCLTCYPDSGLAVPTSRAPRPTVPSSPPISQ